MQHAPLYLQMSTEDDLIKLATMYHVLFELEGFKMWWAHPNAARAPGARMHPESVDRREVEHFLRKLVKGAFARL